MRKFSIVKNYKLFFAITIIFLLVGFGSMIVRGFNLGIDFTGGSIMDLNFQRPVAVAEVRDVLKEHNLGNSIIQLESSDANVKEAKGVLIRTGVIDDEQRRAVMDNLKGKLGEFEIQRVENVGATVGGELIQQAVLAIVLSWFLMIAYITMRFEFKFAIAAIIALIIDVSVTLSYFSLFHMELDSSFVAALLTVVGYSINGTIVIFDRIRENLAGGGKKQDYEKVVDDSVNMTLTRSLFTNLTTFASILMLYVLGVASIKEFTLPMMVGIIAGACSSVFLTGPLWYWMRTHFGPGAAELRLEQSRVKAKVAHFEDNKTNGSQAGGSNAASAGSAVRSGGNPNVIRKKKVKKKSQ